MIRFLRCFALLAGLAGCATQPSSPCRLGHVTDLPFTITNGHLLVDAATDGGTLSLVFDTGASTTTLKRAAAERVHLGRDDNRLVYVQGVGGQENGFVARPHHFTLGALHGTNLAFLVSDIDLLGFADGLLSTDFLSKYDIDFDVPERRIRLFDYAGACDTPHAFLSGTLTQVPMRFGERARSPLVEVMVSGKRLTAVVDTGAAVSTLFRSAAERTGLSDATIRAGRAMGIGGVGGARRAFRHVLPEVMLGDLTIRNMPVAIADVHGIPEADMLLGLDFLSRVHLWISYSSKSIVLQYPPLPSPPLRTSGPS